MRDDTIYTYGQICRVLTDALPKPKETELAGMFDEPVLVSTQMHNRAMQLRVLTAKQMDTLEFLYNKIDPTDVSYDRLTAEQAGQFTLGYYQDPATVGTKKAAEMLGISVARVKQLINDGVLTAGLDRGAFAISVCSIKHEIARRENKRME